MEGYFGQVFLLLWTPVAGLAAFALDQVQAYAFGYSGWPQSEGTIWRLDVLDKTTAEAERGISKDLRES